jgi:hypothetical protein
MRTLRAAALALLALLVACEAHRPTASGDDGIIHDSGRCDAVSFGTDFSRCHWHHFSVGVDPGTAFSRAIGPPGGVTEVPVVVEGFPARWLSVQASTAPGPGWPSPLSLGARLHACGDEGCTWYVGGYWEPWQRSPGVESRWVLGAALGYRFDSHLDWSSCREKEAPDGGATPCESWGPHVYAAPALAVDLWSQAGAAPGTLSPSPHLQFEVGWSF